MAFAKHGTKNLRYTMVNLMNIALIWAIFFTTAFSQVPLNDRPQEANQYCNDEYRFCATFPSSILTFQATLIQGNGIILKPEDGFAEVTIAGYSLPAKTNAKQLFLSLARKKSALGVEPKIISSLFGEDFYECYFLVGKSYYYQQCFLIDEHFVWVEIKVPINRPDKMQILQKQISLEFNSQSAAVKATSSLDIGALRE